MSSSRLVQSSTTIKITNDHELVMVDDDEMELVLIQRFIRRSRVTNPLMTFRSGDEFLKYLDAVADGRQRMPALVFVDVRMPLMDGFDVVKNVRSRPSFGTMPIIMMFSNSDNQSDIRKAMESGANHYQVKPSNGEAYVALLNSLVD